MARLSSLLRMLAFVLAVPLLAAPLLAGGTPPAQTVGSGVGRASGWLWPLEPRPAVVRVFDPPERPWLSGHRGVDLGANPGQALVAPEGGAIAFAEWVVDRPVLTVDHGNGLRSSFEPVETELKVGAQVTRGQIIGRIASLPPHCAGACLHWGVRQGDDYVDPLRYVADMRPSVLLPWRDP